MPRGTTMMLIWMGVSFWWCRVHLPWMFEDGGGVWAAIGGLVSGQIALFIKVLFDADLPYEEDDDLE